MESGFAILRQRTASFLARLSRRLHLFTVNREILVFSIFLCVAIIFWFSQTYKDHTTVNIEYKLEFVNVPKNVIFTSEVPKTVNVSLSGKGFSVLQYIINNKSKSLKLDYSELTKIGGIMTIDNYVWKKVLAKELPSGVGYSSIAPSTIEIYYSMGEHKQIPVVFKGKIRTSDQYLLCGIDVQPQYIDIYAPSPQYDTIRTVYTEPVIYNNLTDTTSFKVAIQKIKGVKMVPDSVEIRACVDLFTTKTMKVPIYCENIPQNKILRTFPLMADVTFRVSATMFNKVVADDFIIVVDYSAIKPDDKKCRLLIREVPDGISNVKVSPEFVDYIIEQEE